MFSSLEENVEKATGMTIKLGRADIGVSDYLENSSLHMSCMELGVRLPPLPPYLREYDEVIHC